MGLPTTEVPHPVELSVTHVDEVSLEFFMACEARHGSSSLLLETPDGLSILLIVILSYIVVRGPPVRVRCERWVFLGESEMGSPGVEKTRAS